MYIKSAEITNIRSIENFKIEFENPAGWHVLIGDNGSGKSTIIRSLALALVGPDEAPGLRADWRDWVSNDEKEGKIELQIEAAEVDGYFGESKFQLTPNIIIFSKDSNTAKFFNNKELKHEPSLNSSEHNWSNEYGWFSVAYGPYRRFTGGNPEWLLVYRNQPRLGSHLSAFSEDVALTKPIEWLVKLNYKELEFRNKVLNEEINNESIVYPSGSEKIGTRLKSTFSIKEAYLEMQSVINNLKKLINSEEFLPNNTKLESISSDGVFFRDGNGTLITVNQLSDGYRSILSLTFELIRQLVRVYNEDAVFEKIRRDDMRITLPGVVLIDEIDAHLHPTWQTKIGQWFLKYFPNIQFIVTTHSPLVCRAAEKGTIWKLAAPGSDEKSEQITGIDRDRLIYGNVLDAYGTEEFGIVDNAKAVDKKEELIQLSKKQIAGKISPEEENKLHELRAIFSTDATIEL